METFVPIFRESVLGGCLVFLLYYVIQNMNKMVTTLEGVGNTLLRIDMRVEQLEARIHDLEKGN